MNIPQAPRCNLCQSPSARYKFSAKGDSHREFDIFECLRCGVAFTFPVPDKEELEKYYGHGYYGEDVRRLHLIKEVFLQLFQTGRRKAIEAYRRKGRLMDIGCGDGRFLKEMVGYGWDVYGLERGKVRADLLKEIEGIKYYNGELVHFNFPSNYFDVVTLWHVLEHLYDPFSELREIARILKRDGLLFMAMPNFDSLQANFGQGQWFHLDPPRHLWHFSPKSLSFILENSGFILKPQNLLSYPYNLFGWWQTALNRCGLPFNHLYHFLKREEFYKKVDLFTRFTAQLFIAVSILFVPLFFSLTLWECMLNRGGTITIIAKRK